MHLNCFTYGLVLVFTLTVDKTSICLHDRHSLIFKCEKYDVFSVDCFFDNGVTEVI